jgi:hypothetical protein
LNQAQEFVADYGTTFTMLWDPTFESWANLGVSLQPSMLLVAPDGTMLGRWAGVPSDDELLDAARRAAGPVDVSSGSERFCGYVERYLQADVVLADVDSVDSAARQRVFDDIRFAANAMAQTATAADADAVRAFADAVVAMATSAIEQDFDLVAARNAGYDELASTVRDRAEALVPVVEARCGAGFAPTS